MKKTFLSIWALALALFTFSLLGQATNAETQTGNVSLSINSGTTSCQISTNISMGTSDVATLLNTGVTLQTGFDGSFICTDYLGSSSGWELTIQTDDLTNGTNIISGTNVEINHATGVIEGDTWACAGGTSIGAIRTEIWSAPYSIMTRTDGFSDKVCQVTIDTVNLRVIIPASQAPGTYTSTLTVTVPNGFESVLN